MMKECQTTWTRTRIKHQVDTFLPIHCQISFVHAHCFRIFAFGKLKFLVVWPNFAKFKNVVHNLGPSETPSYSVSHQAPNYAQRSQISQNISKQFGAVTVWFRIFFQLT